MAQGPPIHVYTNMHQQQKMGIREDCGMDSFIIGSAQRGKPTGISSSTSSQSSTCTTKYNKTIKSHVYVHVCVPSRQPSYSQAADGMLCHRPFYYNYTVHS